MRSALLFLVAGILATIPLCAQQSRTDVPSLLPVETLLHAEIDLKPITLRGDQLALSKIFNEPNMKRFLAPLEQVMAGQLASLEEQLREAAGVGFEELQSLDSARITISLVDFYVQSEEKANYSRRDLVPDFVITVDFGDALPHFRKALHRLEDLVAGASGLPFEDVTIAGRPVRFMPAPVAKDFGMFHILHEESLVITTSRTGMARFLARLASKGGGKTLADNPDFQDVRRNVAGADTIVWGWCNVNPLLGKVVSTLPEESRDVFGFWGIETYGGVGYGMNLDGAGIRDRIYARLVDKNPWAEAYPAPQKLRTPDLLPAETGVYGAGLLDFGGAYDALLRLGDESYARAAGEWRSMVTQLETELRVNLRDDFLGAFGPEYAFYMAWPGQAVIPDMGLLLEVKANARAKIERIIETAQAAIEDTATLRSLKYRGHTIRWLDFAASGSSDGMSSAFGPQNMKPSFAFVGDWFVVTLWPQSLKNLIHGLEAKEPRLRQRPDFARLHARLSPAGEEHSLFYMDMEGFAGFMLDNAIPAIQSFVPIPPDFPLELAAFPTSETVTQHMFGMMGVGRWTGGNAVQTETYSPTGVVPLYGAAVGTIVLPWILLSSSTVQFSQGPMPMAVPGTLVIEDQASVDGAHSDEESRNHTAAHRRLKVLSLMVRAFQDWEDRLPKEDEWPKFILGGSENHPDSYGDALPNDPWDHPYVYQRLDGGGYRILSYGRDGKPGGEGPDADISVNGR